MSEILWEGGTVLGDQEDGGEVFHHGGVGGGALAPLLPIGSHGYPGRWKSGALVGGGYVNGGHDLHIFDGREDVCGEVVFGSPSLCGHRQ